MQPPSPARMAAQTDTPAKVLARNLATYAGAPLPHDDIVALAHALEEHDAIPIDRERAAARRTAIWVNHGLVAVDGNMLIPTDKAADAISGLIERSIDPAYTYGEPTSPLVNGKASTADTVRTPGRPVVATASHTRPGRKRAGVMSWRVGLAAVGSTGRWGMIRFRVYGDHRPAVDAARAVAFGARLYTGPATALTPNAAAADMIDRWRRDAAHGPAPVPRPPHALSLEPEEISEELTYRSGLAVRPVDASAPHPLYQIAASLAEAASLGDECQSSTGRPWSDVAADMATQAAAAFRDNPSVV